MEENVPFPDSPSSGFINIDGAGGIRPCDIVRVMDEQENDTEAAYEVLSVRGDDSVMAWDSVADELVHLSSTDVERAATDDHSYMWTILFRDMIPIENDSTTLVLFFYAIDAPTTPENTRGLVFQWCFTPQDPVKLMPEPDGLVMESTFSGLRETVGSGSPTSTSKEVNGDITELHDQITGISPAIDAACRAAEFNARQLFETHEEPTYGDDEKQRLKEHACSLASQVESANNVFI